MIKRNMSRPDFRAGFIHEATTDETVELGTKLSLLGKTETAETDNTRNTHLALAERIDVDLGEICVSISVEHLVGVLDVDQARVAEDLLTIASPFQHRKRGVETKLTIDNEPEKTDETLLRNIARAQVF